MQPSRPKAVAPLHTAPRWPQGYVAVLRQAGAKESSIPYFLGWVRRFFAQHAGRRRRDLGRAEIEAFLAEIARRPEISNWQLQQARDALELYYEQFRGIPLDPRPQRPAPPTPWPAPPRGQPPSLGESRAETPCQASTSAPICSRGPIQSKPILSSVGPAARQPTARAAGPETSASPKAPLPAPEAARVNWRALEAKLREALRVAHYSYRTEQALRMEFAGGNL